VCVCISLYHIFNLISFPFFKLIFFSLFYDSAFIPVNCDEESAGDSGS